MSQFSIQYSSDDLELVGTLVAQLVVQGQGTSAARAMPPRAAKFVVEVRLEHFQS